MTLEPAPEPSGSPPIAGDPDLAARDSLRERVAAIHAVWNASAWDANASPPPDLLAETTAVVSEVMAALEAGTIRAATPDSEFDGGWRVHAWVKSAILLGFRLPGSMEVRDGPILSARDKAAFGTLDLLQSESARAAAAAGAPWRAVPGGTSVRRGAHLEPGVALMPPSFVNVGAWVGAGTMIDSHVLVGSCAQVGEGVHLSAAVQVGGVLEPAGARPVIVEDGAFVGGGAGLYEGVVVSRGAVIGAGTVITGQSRLLDLVEERELRGMAEAPLVVPPGAVVVPGSRPAASPWGRAQGLALSVPVIVKYRDEGTDARVALERALR